MLPLAFVFLAASAVALLVNYPDAADSSRNGSSAHGSAAMLMVTTVLGGGSFHRHPDEVGHAGVACARTWSTSCRPACSGTSRSSWRLASMPLSLAFDPDSFYFGLLPVVAQASEAAGGSAMEVGARRCSGR